MDQMEPSVAPPRLTTCAPGDQARTRGASVKPSQSPDSSTNRNGNRSDSPLLGPRPSSSISSRAGTEFHTVTPALRTSDAQRCGSREDSGSGNTTAPPAASAPNRSYTDRSKD